jgi:hypothetical protein
MFGKKRKQWDIEHQRMAERRADWARGEKRAARLYARAHQLKGCVQSDLGRLAVALFRDAQHELALLEQSISERTKHDEPPHYISPNIGDEELVGDAATSTAEGLAGLIRENHTNPQTLFEAMSEQFPKVHFTIDYYDATALIAASLREQRLLGIVEGLELAGINCDD